MRASPKLRASVHCCRHRLLLLPLLFPCHLQLAVFGNNIWSTVPGWQSRTAVDKERIDLPLPLLPPLVLCSPATSSAVASLSSRHSDSISTKCSSSSNNSRSVSPSQATMFSRKSFEPVLSLFLSLVFSFFFSFGALTRTYVLQIASAAAARRLKLRPTSGH